MYRSDTEKLDGTKGDGYAFTYYEIKLNRFDLTMQYDAFVDFNDNEWISDKIIKEEGLYNGGLYQCKIIDRKL